MNKTTTQSEPQKHLWLEPETHATFVELSKATGRSMKHLAAEAAADLKKKLLGGRSR